jgi:DNA-binding MarR family transcriptional regulator
MDKITWDDLNERQQTYLKLIYENDQVQEQNEKWRAARTWHPQPASVWRWILYANTEYGHTPLKQAIKDAGYVDPGTGSTFKALEERGLILVESERINPHRRSELVVNVQITKVGRKLVRDALNITARAALPVGTLREWHWKALCRAYVCGDEGFHSDTKLEDGFGYVSWNTCLRLRDYIVKGQERALIKEVAFPGAKQIAPGYYQGYEYRLCITEYGKQYYRENWQRYQEVYPEVKAPEPEREETV